MGSLTQSLITGFPFDHKERTFTKKNLFVSAKYVSDISMYGRNETAMLCNHQRLATKLSVPKATMRVFSKVLFITFYCKTDITKT